MVKIELWTRWFEIKIKYTLKKNNIYIYEYILKKNMGPNKLLQPPHRWSRPHEPTSIMANAQRKAILAKFGPNLAQLWSIWLILLLSYLIYALVVVNILKNLQWVKISCLYFQNWLIWPILAQNLTQFWSNWPILSLV